MEKKCTYHGVKIGESIDERGGLSESLLESVAEIVRGIGGNDEHRLSNPR